MKIENLSFSYQDKKIFEDFSFDFEEGKVTCIMGSSGGGKTTLLNCISGQLDYNGKICYGQNGDEKDIKISYIFQQPRLIPSLTVKENIMFVLDKKNRQEANIKAEDMIEKMNLQDCKNSYPSHISGGQASRTAIARALAIQSDILLMDEPFKGLDIKLKNYIFELLKPLISQKSVIFVTHDVEEALSVADRIVVLSREKNQAVKIIENIPIDDDKNCRDIYTKKLNDIRKKVFAALLK